MRNFKHKFFVYDEASTLRLKPPSIQAFFVQCSLLKHLIKNILDIQFYNNVLFTAILNKLYRNYSDICDVIDYNTEMIIIVIDENNWKCNWHLYNHV